MHTASDLLAILQTHIQRDASHRRRDFVVLYRDSHTLSVEFRLLMDQWKATALNNQYVRFRVIDHMVDIPSEPERGVVMFRTCDDLDRLKGIELYGFQTRNWAHSPSMARALEIVQAQIR